MTFRELKNNGIEVQSQYKLAYYDYDKDERVELPEKEAQDMEIHWIYADNNILYIEVEMEGA